MCEHMGKAGRESEREGDRERKKESIYIYRKRESERQSKQHSPVRGRVSAFSYAVARVPPACRHFTACREINPRVHQGSVARRRRRRHARSHARHSYARRMRARARTHGPLPRGRMGGTRVRLTGGNEDDEDDDDGDKEKDKKMNENALTGKTFPRVFSFLFLVQISPAGRDATPHAIIQVAIRERTVSGHARVARVASERRLRGTVARRSS